MKYKELAKLDKKELEKKMKELKLELVKSQTGTAKSTGKSRQIKKIIARIHTVNKSLVKTKEELKHK